MSLIPLHMTDPPEPDRSGLPSQEPEVAFSDGIPVIESPVRRWTDPPMYVADPTGTSGIGYAMVVGDLAHFVRVMKAREDGRRIVREGMADVIAWLAKPSNRWRRGACPIPDHPENIYRPDLADPNFRRCQECKGYWTLEHPFGPVGVFVFTATTATQKVQQLVNEAIADSTTVGGECLWYAVEKAHRRLRERGSLVLPA